MLRIVLVEIGEGDWRTFRQPQWMARVRKLPELATRPRLHFDIDETAYKIALAEWDGFSREIAVAMLERLGAMEIRRE